jgi:membrane-bound acyltransferase YfiQ involved in biofilm formation
MNTNAFLIISHSLLLRMFQRNVVEKIKTHIVCSITVFFFKVGAVCKIT